MKNKFPVFLCALFPLAALLFSGCNHVFWSNQPAFVTVVDADTRAPIAHADVGIHFVSSALDEFHPNPDEIHAQTDSFGQASLDGATWRPQIWSVTAAGYAKYEKTYTDVAPSELIIPLHRQP
jgi:hypothetical protein